MKSVKNLQDGFIKYHGCGLYRRDGTNILVTNKRPCKFPITNCFWMDSANVKRQIRTRFRKCNDEIILHSIYKTQYQKEAKTNHESYSSEYESNTESDNESDSDRLVIDENK